MAKTGQICVVFKSLAFNRFYIRESNMKLIATCLLLIIIIGQNQAATFCINDANEFETALDQARQNNQDDHIKIRSGDYMTINNERFIYFNSEDFDLKISGGWVNFNQIDCFQQLGKPWDTTLDGNDLSEVLYIQNNDNSANITVENLTISSGFSDSVGNPGGLKIYSDVDYSGKILLDQILFIGNEGPNGVGSALYVLNGHEITVRNSVFIFNTSNNGFGAAMFSLAANQRGVYFINNTLIYNDTNSEDTSVFNASGLYMILNDENGITPSALIANNLFWDNENSDFAVSFSGGKTYVYNNNYERGSGLIEDQAYNLSLPPQLAPAILDFTPQITSPLIDKGKRMPEIIPIPTPFLLGWNHGNEDFDQGIFGRVINGRVDIGAVEAPPEPPIFKNGFE
jgi:hypothetical protein